MAIETERKFLLASEAWREAAGPARHLVQGYFAMPPGTTLRVRLIDDVRAVLTIKGLPQGLSRSEFEYAIPLTDAQAMLKEFCGTRVVEKFRYLVPFAGATWEVDEYLGRNAGLFTAELELDSPGANFAVPPWLGREISGDKRYTNGALSRMPFTLWPEDR